MKKYVFGTPPPDPDPRLVSMFALSARKLLKSLFCFNLDARSVPEALVKSFRILMARSIVLKHLWLKS